MDLRPSEEQQQLVDAYRALYAKESPPERVREAEPLGFDQRLWDQLGELGSVAMAVDEAHGGWGASVLDLALVAQEHGRALGAAPLIETQVAAHLCHTSATKAPRPSPVRSTEIVSSPSRCAPLGSTPPDWCPPVPSPPTSWCVATTSCCSSRSVTIGSFPRTSVPYRWRTCH